MKRRITYSLLLLFAALSLSRAQNNAQYSQYMFNTLLFNPAYTGSRDALNITALYRSQWTAVAGAPRNISASADAPLKNKKINLGITVENEEVGLFDHTQVNLLYAFRVRLGPGKLSLGLKAGFDSRRLRRDDLTVTDADDPMLYNGANVTNRFVSGAGAYYFTSRYYFGIAAPSLVGALPGQQTLLQLHGGLLVDLSKQTKLKPALLIRSQKELPVYANISTLVYYREIIGIGGGYTYQNNWLALVDLRINDQLNFGYAYERQAAQNSTFKAGSHEVMLRYLFRYRISSVNPRFF